MNPHLRNIWTAADSMFDTFLSRIPSLILAAVVFVLFERVSALASFLIRRATKERRHNIGVVLARLVSAGVMFLGFLVSFSIIAPSFRAADLIKVLGIGSVAIGFAFQNILQNFLAGLLLLWTEPFRVGDQIRLDPFEGTVEDIETRATTIKTYDGRRVVIPNADLFTHPIPINTAFDARRWESEIIVDSAGQNLADLKSQIVETVRHAEGVLPEPAPEAMVVDMGEPGAETVRLRISWWTRPRSHQMQTVHDHVITALKTLLRDMPSNPSGNRRDRAA